MLVITRRMTCIKLPVWTSAADSCWNEPYKPQHDAEICQTLTLLLFFTPFGGTLKTFDYPGHWQTLCDDSPLYEMYIVCIRMKH